MVGTGFKCCAAILATMIACTDVGGEGARDESKDKPFTTVRAQDIPKTVRIVGRLGQPLGDLLTIRGKWTSPGLFVKDDTLVFHVNLVNGKKPKESPGLHGLQVSAIFPTWGGRKPKPGESWDWRFHWGGSEPSPTPVEGETWEMMGVETGSFQEYSKDAWREIGGPAAQGSPSMAGFVTRFEFIAVRKIR
jgi:hypothetical protein